jgi:Predicted helicase
VPSIALLRQTLSEWSTFADLPLDSICVCSDVTASKGRNEDSQQNIDLALPATTDVAKIVARFKQNNPKTGLKVVFSTYQSLERISEAQKIFGDDST